MASLQEAPAAGVPMAPTSELLATDLPLRDLDILAEVLARRLESKLSFTNVGDLTVAVCQPYKRGFGGDPGTVRPSERECFYNVEEDALRAYAEANAPANIFGGPTLSVDGLRQGSSGSGAGDSSSSSSSRQTSFHWKKRAGAAAAAALEAGTAGEESLPSHPSLPPHIFSVVAQAMSDIVQEYFPAAVVLQGEVGSGKSMLLQLALRYVRVAPAIYRLVEEEALRKKRLLQMQEEERVQAQRLQKRKSLSAATAASAASSAQQSSSSSSSSPAPSRTMLSNLELDRPLLDYMHSKHARLLGLVGDAMAVLQAFGSAGTLHSPHSTRFLSSTALGFSRKAGTAVSAVLNCCLVDHWRVSLRNLQSGGAFAVFYHLLCADGQVKAAAGIQGPVDAYTALKHPLLLLEEAAAAVQQLRQTRGAASAASGAGSSAAMHGRLSAEEEERHYSTALAYYTATAKHLLSGYEGAVRDDAGREGLEGKAVEWPWGLSAVQAAQHAMAFQTLCQTMERLQLGAAARLSIFRLLVAILLLQEMRFRDVVPDSSSAAASTAAASSVAAVGSAPGASSGLGGGARGGPTGLGQGPSSAFSKRRASASALFFTSASPAAAAAIPAAAGAAAPTATVSASSSWSAPYCSTETPTVLASIAHLLGLPADSLLSCLTNAAPSSSAAGKRLGRDVHGNLLPGGGGGGGGAGGKGAATAVVTPYVAVSASRATAICDSLSCLLYKRLWNHLLLHINSVLAAEGVSGTLPVELLEASLQARGWDSLGLFEESLSKATAGAGGRRSARRSGSPVRGGNYNNNNNSSSSEGPLFDASSTMKAMRKQQLLHREQELLARKTGAAEETGGSGRGKRQERQEEGALGRRPPPPKPSEGGAELPGSKGPLSPEKQRQLEAMQQRVKQEQMAAINSLYVPSGKEVTHLYLLDGPGAAVPNLCNSGVLAAGAGSSAGSGLPAPGKLGAATGTVLAASAAAAADASDAFSLVVSKTAAFSGRGAGSGIASGSSWEGLCPYGYGDLLASYASERLEALFLEEFFLAELRAYAAQGHPHPLLVEEGKQPSGALSVARPLPPAGGSAAATAAALGPLLQATARYMPSLHLPSSTAVTAIFEGGHGLPTSLFKVLGEACEVFARDALQVGLGAAVVPPALRPVPPALQQQVAVLPQAQYGSPSVMQTALAGGLLSLSNTAGLAASVASAVGRGSTHVAGLGHSADAAAPGADADEEAAILAVHAGVLCPPALDATAAERLVASLTAKLERSGRILKPQLIRSMAVGSAGPATGGAAATATATPTTPAALAVAHATVGAAGQSASSASIGGPSTHIESLFGIVHSHGPVYYSLRGALQRESVSAGCEESSAAALAADATAEEKRLLRQAAGGVPQNLLLTLAFSTSDPLLSLLLSDLRAAEGAAGNATEAATAAATEAESNPFLADMLREERGSQGGQDKAGTKEELLQRPTSSHSCSRLSGCLRCGIDRVLQTLPGSKKRFVRCLRANDLPLLRFAGPLAATGAVAGKGSTQPALLQALLAQAGLLHPGVDVAEAAEAASTSSSAAAAMAAAVASSVSRRSLARQLAASRVLHASLLHSFHFPVRLPWEEFYSRYSLLEMSVVLQHGVQLGHPLPRTLDQVRRQHKQEGRVYAFGWNSSDSSDSGEERAAAAATVPAGKQKRGSGAEKGGSAATAPASASSTGLPRLQRSFSTYEGSLMEQAAAAAAVQEGSSVAGSGAVTPAGGRGTAKAAFDESDRQTLMMLRRQSSMLQGAEEGPARAAAGSSKPRGLADIVEAEGGSGSADMSSTATLPINQDENTMLLHAAIQHMQDQQQQPQQQKRSNLPEAATAKAALPADAAGKAAAEKLQKRRRRGIRSLVAALASKYAVKGDWQQRLLPSEAAVEQAVEAGLLLQGTQRSQQQSQHGRQQPRHSLSAGGLPSSSSSARIVNPEQEWQRRYTELLQQAPRAHDVGAPFLWRSVRGSKMEDDARTLGSSLLEGSSSGAGAAPAAAAAAASTTPAPGAPASDNSSSLLLMVTSLQSGAEYRPAVPELLLGSSHVLLSRDMHRKLEKARLRMLQRMDAAALCIQFAWAGMRQRLAFLKGRSAAVALQAMLKMKRARRGYQRYIREARKVRWWLLTRLLCWRFRKARKGVLLLQQKWRYKTITQCLSALSACIHRLHALARGVLIRAQMTKQSDAARVVVRACSAYVQRRREAWLRNSSALKVQALWRGCLSRVQNAQAVTLLAEARMARFRAKHLSKLASSWKSKLLRARFLQLRWAAVVIRSWWMARGTRLSFQRKRLAAVRIQAAVRGAAARAAIASQRSQLAGKAHLQQLRQLTGMEAEAQGHFAAQLSRIANLAASCIPLVYQPQSSGRVGSAAAGERSGQGQQQQGQKQSSEEAAAVGLSAMLGVQQLPTQEDFDPSSKEWTLSQPFLQAASSATAATATRQMVELATRMAAAGERAAAGEAGYSSMPTAADSGSSSSSSGFWLDDDGSEDGATGAGGGAGGGSVPTMRDILLGRDPAEQEQPAFIASPSGYAVGSKLQARRQGREQQQEQEGGAGLLSSSAIEHKFGLPARSPTAALVRAAAAGAGAAGDSWTTGPATASVTAEEDSGSEDISLFPIPKLSPRQMQAAVLAQGSAALPAAAGEEQSLSPASFLKKSPRGQHASSSSPSSGSPLTREEDGRKVQFQPQASHRRRGSMELPPSSSLSAGPSSSSPLGYFQQGRQAEQQAQGRQEEEKRHQLHEAQRLEEQLQQQRQQERDAQAAAGPRSSFKPFSSGSVTITLGQTQQLPAAASSSSSASAHSPLRSPASQHRARSASPLQRHAAASSSSSIYSAGSGSPSPHKRSSSLETPSRSRTGGRSSADSSKGQGEGVPVKDVGEALLSFALLQAVPTSVTGAAVYYSDTPSSAADEAEREKKGQHTFGSYRAAQAEQELMKDLLPPALHTGAGSSAQEQQQQEQNSSSSWSQSFHSLQMKLALGGGELPPASAVLNSTAGNPSAGKDTATAIPGLQGPATAQSVVSLAIGSQTSFALSSSGAVYSWGVREVDPHSALGKQLLPGGYDPELDGPLAELQVLDREPRLLESLLNSSHPLHPHAVALQAAKAEEQRLHDLDLASAAGGDANVQFAAGLRSSPSRQAQSSQEEEDEEESGRGGSWASSSRSRHSFLRKGTGNGAKGAGAAAAAGGSRSGSRRSISPRFGSPSAGSAAVGGTAVGGGRSLSDGLFGDDDAELSRKQRQEEEEDRRATRGSSSKSRRAAVQESKLHSLALQRLPAAARTLAPIRISAIAAGAEHVLLLSEGSGLVYAMGSNSSGQCGLGKASYDPITSPHLILQGLQAVYSSGAARRITAIAAGQRHSLLLSRAGSVYGFGASSSCGVLQPLEQKLLKLLQAMKTDAENASHLAAEAAALTLETTGGLDGERATAATAERRLSMAAQGLGSIASLLEDDEDEDAGLEGEKRGRQLLQSMSRRSSSASRATNGPAPVTATAEESPQRSQKHKGDKSQEKLQQLLDKAKQRAAQAAAAAEILPLLRSWDLKKLQDAAAESEGAAQLLEQLLAASEAMDSSSSSSSSSGSDARCIAVPTALETLSQHNIVQLSCGSAHSLALSSSGLVFGWGSNSNGQLGLGQLYDRAPWQEGAVKEGKGGKPSSKNSFTLPQRRLPALLPLYDLKLRYCPAGALEEQQRKEPFEQGVRSRAASRRGSIGTTTSSSTSALAFSNTAAAANGSLSKALQQLREGKLRSQLEELLQPGMGPSSAADSVARGSVQQQGSSSSKWLWRWQKGHLLRIKQIAAGSKHSLFLTEQGDLYAAGGNAAGQCGTGSREDAHTAVPVVLAGRAVAFHASALESISQATARGLTAAAVTAASTGQPAAVIAQLQEQLAGIPGLLLTTALDAAATAGAVAAPDSAAQATARAAAASGASSAHSKLLSSRAALTAAQLYTPVCVRDVAAAATASFFLTEVDTGRRQQLLQQQQAAGWLMNSSSAAGGASSSREESSAASLLQGLEASAASLLLRQELLSSLQSLMRPVPELSQPLLPSCLYGFGDGASELLPEGSRGGRMAAEAGSLQTLVPRLLKLPAPYDTLLITGSNKGRRAAGADSQAEDAETEEEGALEEDLLTQLLESSSHAGSSSYGGVLGRAGARGGLSHHSHQQQRSQAGSTSGSTVSGIAARRAAAAGFVLRQQPFALLTAFSTSLSVVCLLNSTVGSGPASSSSSSALHKNGSLAAGSSVSRVTFAMDRQKEKDRQVQQQQKGGSAAASGLDDSAQAASELTQALDRREALRGFLQAAGGAAGIVSADEQRESRTGFAPMRAGSPSRRNQQQRKQGKGDEMAEQESEDEAEQAPAQRLPAAKMLQLDAEGNLMPVFTPAAQDQELGSARASAAAAPLSPRNSSPSPSPFSANTVAGSFAVAPVITETEVAWNKTIRCLLALNQSQQKLWLQQLPASARSCPPPSLLCGPALLVSPAGPGEGAEAASTCSLTVLQSLVLACAASRESPSLRGLLLSAEQTVVVEKKKGQSEGQGEAQQGKGKGSGRASDTAASFSSHSAFTAGTGSAAAWSALLQQKLSRGLTYLCLHEEAAAAAQAAQAAGSAAGASHSHSHSPTRSGSDKSFLVQHHLQQYHLGQSLHSLARRLHADTLTPGSALEQLYLLLSAGQWSRRLRRNREKRASGSALARQQVLLWRQYLDAAAALRRGFFASGPAATAALSHVEQQRALQQAQRQGGRTDGGGSSSSSSSRSKTESMLLQHGLVAAAAAKAAEAAAAAAVPATSDRVRQKQKQLQSEAAAVAAMAAERAALAAAHGQKLLSRAAEEGKDEAAARRLAVLGGQVLPILPTDLEAENEQLQHGESKEADVLLNGGRTQQQPQQQKEVRLPVAGARKSLLAVPPPPPPAPAAGAGLTPAGAAAVSAAFDLLQPPLIFHSAEAFLAQQQQQQQQQLSQSLPQRPATPPSNAFAALTEGLLPVPAAFSRLSIAEEAAAAAAPPSAFSAVLSASSLGTSSGSMFAPLAVRPEAAAAGGAGAVLRRPSLVQLLYQQQQLNQQQMQGGSSSGSGLGAAASSSASGTAGSPSVNKVLASALRAGTSSYFPRIGAASPLGASGTGAGPAAGRPAGAAGGAAAGLGMPPLPQWEMGASTAASAEGPLFTDFNSILAWRERAYHQR